MRGLLTGPGHRPPERFCDLGPLQIEIDGEQVAPRGPRVAVSPGRPVRAGVGLPLLLIAVFFLCWNTASSTLGNYGTYFVVTVTGLSQTQATGLVLVTFPPALVMSLIFVRLADTVWRDRIFVLAMIVQIVAFTVGAVTGGAVVGGMVALVVLYSLSHVFGGEDIYKVWSQLLLPADLRATGIGLTYAVARAAAATFLLIVPFVIERDPTLLLWILVGCVTASGLVGTLIVRLGRFAAPLHPVHP